MNMEIVTRKNYQLVEALNELLKEANVVKRITLKVVENKNEVGVIVEIPPLFNPEKPSYFLPLKENYKQSELSYNDVVKNINIELEDLLMTIKPDILKLTCIAAAFKVNKPVTPREEVAFYTVVIKLKL